MLLLGMKFSMNKFVSLAAQITRCWLNLAIKIGLGFLLLGFGLLIAVPWFAHGSDHVIRLLSEWQTLIAGFTALFASFIGFAASTGAIREARWRKARSERVMLNFRLSSLCTILSTNGRALQKASVLLDDGKKVEPIEWLTVPPELVDGFRRNIESSPPEVDSALIRLLEIVQILQARGLSSQSLERPTSALGVYELRAQAIGLAEAHALASGLFDFARRRSEFCLAIEQEHILNSLKQFDFWPEQDLVSDSLTLGDLLKHRFDNGHLLSQQISAT